MTKKSYLGSENSRLNQLERLAVDADQALAGLALGDSSRVLLLAEALNHLSGSHVCGVGWWVVVKRKRGAEFGFDFVGFAAGWIWADGRRDGIFAAGLGCGGPDFALVHVTIIDKTPVLLCRPT